jgi:NIPSNAP protein
MLYELRTYRCMPGKVNAVIDRFPQYGLPLWKKHGIDPVGFWKVAVGNSNHDFIYMLRWQNAGDREQKWNAFLNDPIWVEGRAGTEKDGPLVMTVNNQLLEPTDFSPMQ